MGLELPDGGGLEGGVVVGEEALAGLLAEGFLFVRYVHILYIIERRKPGMCRT